ncbi:hypothetical protein LWI29_035562 [Acer saccharum]|uniref:Beta-galactosidase beta-sandwich domain-containing protein n=1 Tax=Acer saccharum TaxID=4024 RepID=A0AA39SLD0_ACESA|nr:hypothetical protein LWI29_035562 [Acer saccharum]
MKTIALAYFKKLFAYHPLQDSFDELPRFFPILEEGLSDELNKDVSDEEVKAGLFGIVILLFIASLTVVVEAYVSYDSRAITINGRRRILISGSIQYPGSTPEAHVFKSNSGACAAFLANYNQKTINAKVAFGNQHYNLPPWSISILPDCKNTVYNTARAGTQSSQMKISPVPLHGGFSWQAYNEADSSFTMYGLLEQINTTKMLQTTCGTRQRE